jgi:chemotaxis protein methyltransferase CheR
MRDSRSWKSAATGYSADVLGLSVPVFVLLRDLIARHTGVHFSDDRRDMLAEKLADLVAAKGMSSYLDFYYLLRYDAHADEHWASVADALAVPETYFWRQPEQILALSKFIAPAHFASHPGRPLRIWSAACCSGEEPLSLAIALDQAGLLGTRPIEIVGSDASAALIERARRGVYGERSFRALPVQLRQRYFTAEPNGWRVDPRVHCAVRWEVSNLVEPDAVRALAAVDVIYCRNVFIYFAEETIASVVAAFAEGLAEDGHLFLGASESLGRIETAFELAELGGAFVYVRGSSARASRDRRIEAGAITQIRGA